MPENQIQQIEGNTTPSLPLGFWTSLVFGIFILISSTFVSILVLEIIQFFTPQTEGLRLTVFAITPGVCIIFLILIIGRLQSVISIGNYFQLETPSKKNCLIFGSLVLALCVSYDLIRWIYTGSIIPQVVVDNFRNAAFPSIFVFAVIVTAPLSEELLFRGFLLSNWQDSRLGNIGAVILTSMIWAALHIQYGAFDIFAIFILGLVLGSAKIMGKSLWLPIALHAIVNFIATVEVYYLF